MFVGDDYYCESGNPNDTWIGGQIFIDKLWDGEQCENEGTCCTTKSLPWFSVELTNPTTVDQKELIMKTLQFNYWKCMFSKPEYLKKHVLHVCTCMFQNIILYILRVAIVIYHTIVVVYLVSFSFFSGQPFQ